MKELPNGIRQIVAAFGFAGWRGLVAVAFRVDRGKYFQNCSGGKREKWRVVPWKIDQTTV
jgi:hypothetical protein